MKRFGLILFIVLGLAVLFPDRTWAQTGTYAALGDSVAAGSGLTGATTICNRSPEAYPYIVAQKTGLSLGHYACIGAKADEGIYDSQERGGSVLSAQLDQAFASGTPKLITMTIGANDARWTQFIRQCYYTRCGYSVDTARFSVYLVDLKLELNTIMAKIHTLSNGSPPQVIVTGYYDPFSSKTCSDTTELTSQEISWLESRISKLNNAIRGTVGKYSYASFAPVSFAKHELCTADTWVQGSTGTMPFHPTAAGQQQIADAVMDNYRSSSESEEPASYRERILNWYQSRN
jgi:lysophospholipase L1-like esterase